MKKYFILGLLILFHLFLLVNLRFTAWPEMLSFPYLRNNGYLLYKDMIHPYPPLLTMTLSVIFKIFGYKLIVLKLFTWMLILTVDVLIFVIVKLLTKNIKYSVFALIFYVIAQPFLDGNMLWFDLAIVPPILLGSYFLICFLDQPTHKASVVAAGLFFGVAALIKQTAGIFLIAGVLWLVLQRVEIKKIGYFILGPVILGLVLVIRLITEGALKSFIDWTIVYPFTFWGKFPGYVQMALSKHQLLTLSFLLSPVVVLLFRVRKSFTKDKHLKLIILFLLLSLVLVYPRFSLFHFQTGIAFAAIVFAVVASKIKTNYFLYISYFALFTYLIVLPVIKSDWGGETRFWSKDEIKLSNVIKDTIRESGLIYLQDLHSGLYVLSDRLPSKPWTDNFGWFLEIPGMQEQIVKRWDTNKPGYIIIKDALPGNWHDMGTYRPKIIADWINKNYFKKEEIQTGVWLWEEK